jgi:hypothetical protein
MPAVRAFCQSDSTIPYCFTIVNNNAVPYTYQWSLAGLPVGPGCTVAGPTHILPSAGSVTVPAGGSAQVCVTIRRPAGLIAPNASACLALTFMNTTTGVCRTRTGKLRADNSCWCAQSSVPANVMVPAGPTGGAGVPIEVGNPCDPIALIAYTVRAVWLDPDHADPHALSLNGLPPGTPVTGNVQGGSSDGTGASVVDVFLRYPNGYDFAARYELVLEADTDADGTPETLWSTFVQADDGSQANVGIPAPRSAPHELRLVTRPNPFLGSSTIEFELAQAENVTLAVYDLSGRQVRALANGRLTPGSHRFTWDGRDERGRRAPGGVYFVRLATAARKVETKLVKMR